MRLGSLFILLSLAALSGVVAAGGEAGTPAEDAPSVLVREQTLATRTLSATVAGYGRVQADPDQITSIALPHAGLVQDLWVRLGQRVKAGDPVLTLATAPAAQVAYQQAKASVDSARSGLSQTEKLFKQTLATRSQVADARRNLRDAQSQLAAQERLGTGESSKVLRAPFSGIVIQLSVTQGQRVQADTAAVQLASGQGLVVPLGVELEDIESVKPGQTVILSPVFRPGVRIAAQVHEVHAMVDPTTHLIDVLVNVPSRDSGAFVLGEDLRGTIVVQQEHALAVSRSAVLQDAAGSYVFLDHAGRARRVAVTTGLEQDGWVAVKGPLAAGDAVVVLGNYELTDGMAVRAENR